MKAGAFPQKPFGVGGWYPGCVAEAVGMIGGF